MADFVAERLTSAEKSAQRVADAKGKKKESLLSKLTDTDTLIDFGGALAALAAGETGAAAGLAGIGLMGASGEASRDNAMREKAIDEAVTDDINLTKTQEAGFLTWAASNPKIASRIQGIGGLMGFVGQQAADVQDALAWYVDDTKGKEEAALLADTLGYVDDPEARSDIFRQIFVKSGFIPPSNEVLDDMGRRDLQVSDFQRAASQATPESVLAAEQWLAEAGYSPENYGAAMLKLKAMIDPKVAANKEAMDTMNAKIRIFDAARRYKLQNPGATMAEAMWQAGDPADLSFVGAIDDDSMGEVLLNDPDFQDLDEDRYKELYDRYEAQLRDTAKNQFKQAGIGTEAEKGLTAKWTEDFIVNTAHEMAINVMRGQMGLRRSLENAHMDQLASTAMRIGLLQRGYTEEQIDNGDVSPEDYAIGQLILDRELQEITSQNLTAAEMQMRLTARLMEMLSDATGQPVEIGPPTPNDAPTEDRDAPPEEVVQITAEGIGEGTATLPGMEEALEKRVESAQKSVDRGRRLEEKKAAATKRREDSAASRKQRAAEREVSATRYTDHDAWVDANIPEDASVEETSRLIKERIREAASARANPATALFMTDKLLDKFVEKKYAEALREAPVGATYQETAKNILNYLESTTD